MELARVVVYIHHRVVGATLFFILKGGIKMEEKKKYNIGGIIKRNIFLDLDNLPESKVIEEFTEEVPSEVEFYKAKVAVHLREDPMISGKIIGVLQREEIITGTEEKNSDWISTPRGFVMKKFMEKVK
jgi:hypothetical protein